MKSKKMLGFVGLVMTNFLAYMLIAGIGNLGYAMANEFNAMEQVGLIFALETAARCASVPISGKLGEKVGRKKLFLIALLGYTAAYLLCAFATNITICHISRVASGLFWGLWQANTFVLFCDLFSQDDGPKYSGINSTFTTIATVIAAPIAGIICASNWRIEYYIAVPLLLISFILCAIGIPENKERDTSGKMDIAGSIFCALFLIPFCLVMSLAPTYGWTSTLSIVLSIISVIGLIGLIVSEKKASNPIFPVRLLKSKLYLAIFVISLAYSAANAAGQYLPSYLQYYEGISSAKSGFVGTPGILISIVATWLLGKYAAKHGKYKKMTVVWSILTLVSGIMFLFIGSASVTSYIFVYAVITSVFIGAVNSVSQIVPYTYSMKVVDQKDLAAASSFLIVSGVFGSAVAGGILGAIMNSPAGMTGCFKLPVVCGIIMVIGALFFKDIKAGEKI